MRTPPRPVPLQNRGPHHHEVIHHFVGVPAPSFSLFVDEVSLTHVGADAYDQARASGRAPFNNSGTTGGGGGPPPPPHSPTPHPTPHPPFKTFGQIFFRTFGQIKNFLRHLRRQFVRTKNFLWRVRRAVGHDSDKLDSCPKCGSRHLP